MDEINSLNQYPNSLSTSYELTHLGDFPLSPQRNILQLSSPKNATRCSVKLMDGEHGGGFYARSVTDKVKKRSWRELILVYPDETTITVPLYRNAFRIMPDNSDGYYIRKGSEPINVPEILKKFEVGMPIPAYTIFKLIQDTPNLPELIIKDSVTIDELFDDLLNYTENISKAAIDKKGQLGKVILNQEKYILISSEDFKSICNQSGWKPLDAIRYFAKIGLLQADLGNGYQYTVRVGEKTRKFYKLWKELPQVKDEVTSRETTTYTDNDVELKREYEKEQMQAKKQKKGKSEYYIEQLL